MGSKNRIAKELLPFITEALEDGIYYVEPFVGGCNMIDKVEHSPKLAADCNKYLIALLEYQGELPEYISKEEFDKVK
jgi:DNA adenine methylase